MLDKVSRIFKKEKPVITFTCAEHLLNVIPHPVKASKALPNWFKQLKPRIENTDKSEPSTAKKCIPMVDAMSQGYIIPLWGEVHVKVTQQYAFYNASGDLIRQVPELKNSISEIEGRLIDNQVVHKVKEDGLFIWMKFPKGFEELLGQDLSNHGWAQVGELCPLKKFKLGQVLLKFNNPWTIETSKGWSTQFKNPSNNFENEFVLFEGTVDTDTYHQEVNLPYIWTGEEIGEWIIPKGTPLVQVIPFKREEIKLKVKKHDQAKIKAMRSLLMSVFQDRYKRLFWHKRKQK